MLSTVVSVQQQPMTQQLLKFGAAKVCKPGQTPLFQREGQPSVQAAKAFLVESAHDSMQRLRVLIYKEADGWNCYGVNDLCFTWRNVKRMGWYLLVIKGSKSLKTLPHPERGLHLASLLCTPPIIYYPSINNSDTCSLFVFTLHHLLQIPTSFPAFKFLLPSLHTHFSRYWPRPPVPVPGGCHGGWASHSQGCSVHSSHRLPWGLPLSTAVGCLPAMKEREGRKLRHVNGIHLIQLEFFLYL